MTDARAVLAANGTFVDVEESIVALEGSTARDTHYDRMGKLYDVVCGTWMYERLVWGTTPARLREFASTVFSSRQTGPHVEVGCGGLLFTSHLYYEDRGRACILIDPSIKMLRMARARLGKRSGTTPSHIVLVLADGLDLPLSSGFATTALSMNVLHVIDQRDAFMRRVGEVVSHTGSTIGLTSLALTGGFRDGFLLSLYRAGELSRPLPGADVDRLVSSALQSRIAVEPCGAMRFITASRN
jgi:SAM-dependent methyltransferase